MNVETQMQFQLLGATHDHGYSMQSKSLNKKIKSKLYNGFKNLVKSMLVLRVQRGARLFRKTIRIQTETELKTIVSIRNAYVYNIIPDTS